MTASPLIPLWLLALSGWLPLPSCLLCVVVEKYSSKMHSNHVAIYSSGLQLCAVAAFSLTPLWLLGRLLLPSCLLCAVVEKRPSKIVQQFLTNLSEWLTALCSGCLPPDPSLAPGTLRLVAAAVLLAVCCSREIFFKNAQQLGSLAR